MVVAVATLFSGAFGALVRKDIRRMFSYLIVCHIGYMISGLSLFTEAALAGTMFYLIHDIVVKTNVFLLTGLIYKIQGSVKFHESGGIYSTYPKFSVLAAVVLFSLVGVPPLSGFWPKIFLLQESFSTGQYPVLIAIIAASFFTLFVIARMWGEVFWKDRPAENTHGDAFAVLPRYKKTLLVLPLLLLAGVSLYIGFGAENIFKVSFHVAGELKDTTPYIKAVLGEFYPK
jgi:multicomponent Na+:H+ antiporter subunit D